MVTFGRERHRDSGMITVPLASYCYYRNCTPSTSESFKSHEKVTRDSVHPNYPKEGGPFESIERTLTYKDSYCGKTGADDSYQIGNVRQVYPFPTGFSWNLPPSKFAECESLGPEAWNRFRPAQPTVSLGQFIAELRDIPGLMFKKLNKFKNLGSNYLAYQFGWRPFLSDLRDWYESCIKLDQQIAQLVRDNGRWIRRGGTLYFNEDISTPLVNGVDYPHYVYPNYYLSSHSTSVEVRTTEKAWFSGAFRYYIPGLSKQKWGRLKSVSKLWGLNLTPELVYELIPFSWLVDWFSNVGDVIGNYTAQMNDNLVAKYAYIMLSKQVTTTVTSECRGEFWARRPGGYTQQFTDYSPASYVLTENWKNRAVASPFGFNFTVGSLSAYQLSILTALGISRLKH